MNEASMTISECCEVQKVRCGATWHPVNDDCFTQVIATMGRECREWTEEAVNLEIETLDDENGLLDYVVVYTDGSVQRGVRS